MAVGGDRSSAREETAGKDAAHRLALPLATAQISGYELPFTAVTNSLDPRSF